MAAARADGPHSPYLGNPFPKGRRQPFRPYHEDRGSRPSPRASVTGLRVLHEP